MNRLHLKNRLPQPTSDKGRALADSIWKRRHELKIRTPHPAKPLAIDIDVTPATLLYLEDESDKELVIRTQSSQARVGSAYATFRKGQSISCGDELWVLHAFRAAQAARLLSELGLDDRIHDPDIQIAYLQKPRKGIFWKIIRAFRSRRPTIAEVLEERLDQEIASRIATTSLESPTTYKMEVGSGVTIDAASFEPILGIHHPNHGTLTLPGISAQSFNARADAMRLNMRKNSPALSGSETARIARVIQICQEAIAIDPQMTDEAGIPILPLIQKHLPSLAEKHEKALLTAKPNERDAINAEVREGLERIIGAIEQGMATASRINRDALRTELHFVALRHPNHDISKAA